MFAVGQGKSIFSKYSLIINPDVLSLLLPSHGSQEEAGGNVSSVWLSWDWNHRAAVMLLVMLVSCLF